jgi:hypothetical protein
MSRISPITGWRTFVAGDRVRTRYKLRGCKRRGVVERREGQYVMVRLRQGQSLLEVYDSELEHY